jgi:Protein of unknown function (DUF3105)
VSDPTRRPARAGSNPPGAGGPGSRAGRRERPRPSYRRESFVERHRTRLLLAGGVVVAAMVIGFLYVGATQKAYACTTLVEPVTPTAAPSGSPRLGQQERDMGNAHVAVGTMQRYTYCPPASGSHFNATGRGPIAARYYPPDEGTEPQGWVHNLEHGALVVLYNCSGGCPDDATLQKLKTFVSAFPASPICKLPAGRIGPVVARFDDMKTKYAALVWDRLLMLDSLDTDQILAFFMSEGERGNPEKQCPAPSPSGQPSTEPSSQPSAGSSGSAGPGGSPAASPSG